MFDVRLLHSLRCLLEYWKQDRFSDIMDSGLDCGSEQVYQYQITCFLGFICLSLENDLNSANSNIQDNSSSDKPSCCPTQLRKDILLNPIEVEFNRFYGILYEYLPSVHV